MARTIASVQMVEGANLSKAGSESHHEPRAGENPARGGFTLLELIVVLAILGLALAMLAPDLRKSLDNLRYRAAARELAATLRYARSQAVNTKNTQEVIIDTQEGSYTLSPRNTRVNAGDGEADEERVGEEGDSGAGGRVRGLPPGLAVKMPEGSYRPSYEEGPLVVRFFAKGNSSGADILLKRGKIQYRLKVDEVTGKVRISSVER